MLMEVLKSKIHGVTITDTGSNYIGSITFDKIFIDTATAGLIDGEKVLVVGINNVERVKITFFKEKYGSGGIAPNGTAARKTQKGNKIISYTQMEMEKARVYNPTLIFPNEKIIC